MSVPATNSTTGNPYTAADAANTGSRVVAKQLGQSDFLKLLTVQLANQDPQKPMDDNSFIAQMAQFSSLQQTQEMVKGFSTLSYSSNLMSASTLLGREVTVKSKDTEVTGTVTGVDATDGTPKVEIKGELYSLDSILHIEPAAVPAA
ncbi:hypothetical protein DB347_04275 [Opitutaceae bacterium EW11]|nr:hypothetical protein DB347_04275 [Opitutaceae bacterium EW11]